MLRFFTPFAACVLTLALVGGCDTATVDVPNDGTIAGELGGDSNFETLVDVLAVAPDVQAVLGQAGPYTLFAPTDDAFFYLGETSRAALTNPSNSALLARILRYHVVPGRLGVEDLTDGATFTTLDGAILTVERRGEIILVEDAEVAIDDRVDASNGVIFPVNDVLRSNLDIGSRLLLLPLIDDFKGYGDRTGTLDVLNADDAFTILAPIDDAFEDLGVATLSLLLERSGNADVLKRILDAHILPGSIDFSALESGTVLMTQDGTTVTFERVNGQLLVDGRQLISEPVVTSSGRIYLLRSLLIDHLNLEERLRISPTQTTFEQHLRRYPDVIAALRSDQEYTVFGYINTGYSLLSSRLREELADPANAALFSRLVRYHVVPGRIPSSELENGQFLTTIDGLALPVQRSEAGLFIGNKLVEEVDIQTENGLLYRLQGVGLPPADLFDSALLNNFVIHVRALRSANLETYVRNTESLAMFAFADTVYALNPGLNARPDLREVLQFHMTEEAILPLFHNQVFMPVYGPSRTVAEGPPDVGFVLDGIVPIGYFGSTLTGDLFIAENFSVPPTPE